MKEFENALSNRVWLNEEGKVEKLYSTDSFKKHYGNQEWLVLEKLGYKFEKKDDRIIMDLFQNESFNDESMSDEDIINVANALKHLHSLPTDGIKISQFEKTYDEFLCEDEETTEDFPVDGTEDLLAERAFEILEEGEQVILHNDVVEGNLLKIDNKIKLIDFEYSGLGNKLFDIASFLTERNISEEQRNLFISQFENVDIDKLNIVCAFLQVFWARWAMYKYDITNKEVYKVIADWKFGEYLKIKDV